MEQGPCCSGQTDGPRVEFELHRGGIGAGGGRIHVVPAFRTFFVLVDDWTYLRVRVCFLANVLFGWHL